MYCATGRSMRIGLSGISDNVRCRGMARRFYCRIRCGMCRIRDCRIGGKRSSVCGQCFGCRM